MHPSSLGFQTGDSFRLLQFVNYIPEEILWILIFATILAVYFLPTIIAILIKHSQIVGIAVVNACFGWSGIGYLLCLIWAFRKPGPGVTVIQQHAYTPPLPPSVPVIRPSLEQELEGLESLKSRQLVTEEEYQIRRQKILNTF